MLITYAYLLMTGNDWVIKTGENFNFEASTTNFFVNVKAWNHPASSPPTIGIKGYIYTPIQTYSTLILLSYI